MKLAPDGTASVLDILEVDKSGENGQVAEIHEPLPDRSSLVSELVIQALNGTLPIRRPLKYNEPPKFDSKHINMVFDHVTGPMTNSEIRDKYGLTDAWVSVILNHPFTEVLEAALLGQIADNLADPMERMRAHVHEAIDVKVQIMRNTAAPATLRNKVANDFLDRVGYGPRIKIDTPKDQDMALPAPIAERFSDALEGAARVSSLDFGKFVQRGGAGATGTSVPPAPTVAEPEKQGTDVASLPSGSTQTAPIIEKAKERVA